MARCLALLALSGLLALYLIPQAAQTHHSIAGVYDSSEQVTIEGDVAEFQFTNPHPILVIDVASESGRESWRLEMDNRFELVRVGMTEETFAAGDRVVATGSRHRSEQRRIYLRRLDRPADGVRYEQIGSRPRFSRR